MTWNKLNWHSDESVMTSIKEFRGFSLRMEKLFFFPIYKNVLKYDKKWYFVW